MTKGCLILILMLFSFETRAQWSLTGNASTSPPSNFIGTLDAKPFMIKVNNQKAGWIDYDPAIANTSFGTYALSSNTTGYYNSAFGFGSLYSNTGGYANTAFGHHTLYSNTNGYNNTALGASSLESNTTGVRNTGVGYGSLYSNSEGNDNTAIGHLALYNNLVSENTAVGNYALYSNTSGYGNTATGYYSLYANTTGSANTALGYYSLSESNGNYNTANGYQALMHNTTGSNNTATGSQSLLNNISGDQNTGIGYQSLLLNTSGSYNSAAGLYSLGNSNGSYNTSIGINSKMNIDYATYTNTTLIGANTIGTASDEVRIGNTLTTSIGGYSNWNTISDIRFKTNIKEDVVGIEFIRKLKPITYHLDIQSLDAFLNGSISNKNGFSTLLEREAMKNKEKIIYSGFIAQDVEKAAKESNYDFSGVDLPKNSNDVYGLRYSDFVIPLVKAVKEINYTNDSLTSILSSIQNESIEFKYEIDSLSKKLQKIIESITLNQQNYKDALLKQNVPNPFSDLTVISYYIPQYTRNSQIVITDINGKVIRKISVQEKGSNGQIRLAKENFSSGIYFYTLFVNNIKIDTRRMIILKK